MKTHYSINNCHIKKKKVITDNYNDITCKLCLKKNKVNTKVIDEIVKDYKDNPTHEEILFHLEKTNIVFPKIMYESEYNKRFCIKDETKYIDWYNTSYLKPLKKAIEVQL